MTSQPGRSHFHHKHSFKNPCCFNEPHVYKEKNWISGLRKIKKSYFKFSEIPDDTFPIHTVIVWLNFKVISEKEGVNYQGHIKIAHMIVKVKFAYSAGFSDTILCITSSTETKLMVKHVALWMICCFGSFGQYFNLYRAVSSREEKENDHERREKKIRTSPTRTYCKQSLLPLSYY